MKSPQLASFDSRRTLFKVQTPDAFAAGTLLRPVHRTACRRHRLAWPTIALFAAVSAFAGNSAHAATATYNGTSTTFSTAFTGGSGTNGEPATGDSLLFNSGTAGTALTDDYLTPGAFSLAGITFSSSALAYTITPATAGTNGFTLASGGTGITNNSTNLETISDLITLSGVQTFTTTAGGGNLTLGGIVSGAGSGITTAGGGTLTLSAANTFTGATTIASGTTLAATVAGALGTSANTGGVAVNGTLNLTSSGNSYTFGGPLIGSGTINATVNNGGNTTALTGISSLSGFTGTINVNEPTAGGAGGKFQLNQSPSAVSAINVAAGASLYLNTSATTAAAISLAGGATGEPYGQIRFGGASTLSGPITLTGTVTAGNATFGGFSGNFAISGAIGQTGGAQGVTVTGQTSGNVFTLSAANTYTGPTIVGLGSLTANLRVTGSIGSTAAPAGAVTVISGSILSGAGNGTTTGILTVASAKINTGGTLTPGATTGATSGALTLNTTSGVTLNGTLAIALGSGGGTMNNAGTFVNTIGGLTVSGATLTLSGTPVSGGVYDLVNYTGTTALGATNEGFSTITGPSGFNYSVVAGTTFIGSTYTGDLELDVIAVPEPSTWAAGTLGLGAVILAMRKRFGALRA